jgi:uncharacterized membrane protein
VRTPLLLLALLTGPWIVTRLAGAGEGARGAAGRWGVTLLFLFTGAGHFAQTAEMTTMLPSSLPWRTEAVLASGLAEIAAALALVPRRTRRVAGWVLAAMLVAFLPVNVWAAFARAPMGGHAWGPLYLLVRVPLQLVILAWIWVFVLRSPPSGASA